MIYELPLSAFSRKIIEAENPGDPISLHRNDPIQMIIRSDRVSSYRRPAEILDDSVRIHIHERISPERLPVIGYQVHIYHLDRLMNFISGGSFIGAPAYSLIRDFCDHYGIESDDIDPDSIYKRWQRYEHKIDKKKASNVPEEKQPLDIITPDQIEDIFRIFLIHISNDLYDKAGRFRYHLIKTLHIYIYDYFFKPSKVELSKKYDLSVRSIYSRINSGTRLFSSYSWESALNLAINVLYPGTKAADLSKYEH